MAYTKAERLIVAEQEVAECHALLAKARKVLVKVEKEVGGKLGQEAATVANEIPRGLAS